jgi:hypothetical protein
MITDEPAQAHRVIAARAQMLESNMREGLHRMLALAERTG